MLEGHCCSPRRWRQGTAWPVRALSIRSGQAHLTFQGREVMGRYLLLWLLGVPIPILILIWAFGGLS
jgi:hypothetical protein